MESSNLYSVLLRNKKYTFGEELEEKCTIIGEKCTIIGEKLKKEDFFKKREVFAFKVP